MRWYYYPLSSKDFTFENIFSTESISPANFYKARQFGFDFIGNVPGLHNDKALILYNRPPKYSVDEDNGATFKFVLQIAESAINIEEIILLDEGIIGYQRTIYLTQENFKILFFSEKDRTIATLQAQTSLPTKGLLKYKRNFQIIEDKICQEFDTAKIALIDFESPDFTDQIRIDIKFNHIKGLIYGLVTGLVGSKSSDEIALLRSLQEITNSFAELKNRAENQSRNLGDKSYIVTTTTQFEKRVGLAISNAEQKFTSRFPKESIDEAQIAEFLFGHFKGRMKDISAAHDLINRYAINDEVLGTDSLNRLKSYVQRNSPDSFLALKFSALQDILKSYLSTFSQVSNSNLRESLNNRFKDILHEITKFVERSFLKSASARLIKLEGITYDHLRNLVHFDSSFKYADPKLIDEFELIANTILNNHKKGKGDASKESLLELVASVGNLFSKTKSSKPTLLYQYMSNEVTSYSLDKVTSIVMKNFVSFAFNPDSLEKLENFMTAKDIDSKWMGYSFWCAYNGFARISTNFVRSIFDSENEIIQREIDGYLSRILTQLQADIDDAGDPLGDNPLVTAKEDRIRAKNDEFYYKFVHNQYKLTLNEFLTLPLTSTNQEVVDAMKKRFSVKKTEGKKIVEAYREFLNDTMLF